MGNCMERCRESEEMKTEQEQQEETGKVGAAKESDEQLVKGGVKVKIVLTREELEWLMVQLKNNEGKKLEEILEEIGRGREKEKEKAKAWRPSLESIMETPEVLEMDR